MNYLTLGFSALLLLCTLLSLIRHPSWVFRTWDFPRFQIFILALVLIAIELFFIQNFYYIEFASVTILAIVIVLQFFWIHPYTFLHPREVKKTKQPDEQKDIAILTSNVLMHNKKVSKLLERVSFWNPDIVILLEGNKWWDSAVSGLDKYYPHSLKHPREDTYGIHLFSKLELRNTELKFLIEDHVPSIHTEVKLRTGEWIKLYAIHPSPPSPTQKDTSRQRDAELITVAKLAKAETMPTIVTGDLNDSAWSYTTKLFRKISGLLDPRIGRGRFSTFHAKIPFMQWPLDHIFHSKLFSLIRLKRLKSVGSDHFPLYTKLQLNTIHKPDNSKGLKSNSEDKKEANQLIKEGKEQAEKENTVNLKNLKSDQ